MKIKIFGAKGMLGRYVKQCLKEQRHYVHGLARKDLDVGKANEESLRVLLKNQDLVINCAGVIKPRMDVVGIPEAIRVNSVFPHLLAKVCEELGIECIHITTDCVFSGKDGFYKESDPHDAKDMYGRSKSLGEPENCTVIRTSILGEEVGQQRSLLEWVKSQAGKNCKGFKNHIWNGVTCLELAKFIGRVINDCSYWKGVRHVYSPHCIDKWSLLTLISEIYDLNITVASVSTPEDCFRDLETEYNEHLLVEIPDLDEQLEELRDYKIE